MGPYRSSLNINYLLLIYELILTLEFFHYLIGFLFIKCSANVNICLLGLSTHSFFVLRHAQIMRIFYKENTQLYAISGVLFIFGTNKQSKGIKLKALIYIKYTETNIKIRN